MKLGAFIANAELCSTTWTINLHTETKTLRGRAYR